MKCLSYYKFVLVHTAFLLLFLSCKKEMPPVSGQTEQASDQQRLKDSVYYYYKLYSLWSDTSIPDTMFSFTDAYDSPLGVLSGLKGMTPFHAGYNGGIDRFSYLEDMDIGVPQSPDGKEMNQGFGIFASIGAVSEYVAYPVLYFVEGGSSAAKAGIRRSDVILGIDEHQDLSIPVSCDAGGCKILDENIHQTVISELLSAMQQNSMRIRVRHVDQSESVVVISSNSYRVNPIIKHNVFSYPAKAIGYLALSSFEEVPAGDTNRDQLDQVFEDFEQHQVEDLIFDLRYNTGGYINTVEYIADKVIGAGNDKALMYKYILNPYLSQHRHFEGNSFDDVYFQRRNHLNLNTVYFLVTDITASASELLINVLRPYLNVVIIAEHEGTYGKPVGFFKQEIMGKTALWAASFKMVNARGETDYWDGIGADQRYVTDDIFHDFGDVEESMVSAAINRALGMGNNSLSPVARSRKIIMPVRGGIDHVNVVPQKGMFN